MNPSTIHDTVWTGKTARELRQHPADVREMFFYLITSPDRNPYGVYFLESDLLAARIGTPRVVPFERSLEILQSAGFCRWDPKSGWIWVIEMARIQYATPLKALDYRCRGAKNWYRTCLRNPFLGPWFDRYLIDFHLEKDPGGVDRRTHEREAEVMGLCQGACRAPSEGAVLSPLVHVRTSNLVLVPEVLEPVQGQLVPADPATIALKGDQLEAAFETLWDLYPKGKQKADAKDEFRKLKPTPAFVVTLSDSIAAHRRSREWTKDGGQFIPRFVNFLKHKGWLDRVEIDRTGPVLSPKTQRNVEAATSFIEQDERGIDHER